MAGRSQCEANVTVTLKPVVGYEPNATIQEIIYAINTPVRELESAVLYELEDGATLSSNGIKLGESSLARLVAIAMAVT